MTITIQDVLFDAGTTQEIDILGKSLGDVPIEGLMAVLRKWSDAGPVDASPATGVLSIPQIDIPDEDE